MEERELQELLRKNPHLRIVGDTSNTRNTSNACNTRTTGNEVIQPDEQLRVEADAMLESHLQAEIRRIALSSGWLYYHTFRSKKSDVGFPDTVLLRAGLKGELYFVECKRQGENPSESQQLWLDTVKMFKALARDFLGMDVIVDGFVWRPLDLLTGRIEKLLSFTPREEPTTH